MADKTIGVSSSTADDLGREASKHGVSRDKVISKMLDFFRIYGIDPFNYDAPADEMQKIIKRLDQFFAFLKKQEKSILLPILTDVTTKGEAKTLQAQTQQSLRDVMVTIKTEIEMLRTTTTQLQEGLRKDMMFIGEKQEESNRKQTKEISQMLQEVVKSMGMGGQKKDVTLSNLQNFE